MRLTIPYVASPDDWSCALACHAMTAVHFVPGTTIDDIAKIVDWQPGYAVWAFRFWEWLLARGVVITDYDLIDYAAWAAEGLIGLKRSTPEKEFACYQAATKDIDALSDDVQRVFALPGLTYRRRKPTMADLEAAFTRGAVCEVTLDSGALDATAEFMLHRVVILEVTPQTVTFHDPRPIGESLPAHTVPRAHFAHAWLDALEAPELCVYERRTEV